jgi:PAS domain S-box-containing protein
MAMVNGAGDIIMVNAQAERVCGYLRAELLGQSLQILVPERLRGRHKGLCETFFANPQPRPMGAGRELYAVKRACSEFPVEITDGGSLWAEPNPVGGAIFVIILPTAAADENGATEYHAGTAEQRRVLAFRADIGRRPAGRSSPGAIHRDPRRCHR